MSPQYHPDPQAPNASAMLTAQWTPAFHRWIYVETWCDGPRARLRCEQLQAAGHEAWLAVERRVVGPMREAWVGVVRVIPSGRALIPPVDPQDMQPRAEQSDAALERARAKARRELEDGA